MQLSVLGQLSLLKSLSRRSAAKPTLIYFILIARLFDHRHVCSFSPSVFCHPRLQMSFARRTLQHSNFHLISVSAAGALAAVAATLT